MASVIAKDKFCRPCEQWKPISAFNKSRRDGLSSCCKECNKRKSGAWRKKNLSTVRAKDRVRAQHNKSKNNARSRQWYVDNKPRIQRNGRAYRQLHGPRINARTAEWKRNNHGAVLEAAAFRKQLKRRATPPWLTKAHRAEMREIYKEAVRLSEETGIPHHVDHISPLVGKNSCGLHVPWNLQILPAVFNLKKGNQE